MPRRKKLHVIGEVDSQTCAQFKLRLDSDSREWINKNTTGSVNSVINLLVKEAIKDIAPLLEKMSITEEL